MRKSGCATFAERAAISMGAMLPSWPFMMKTLRMPSRYTDSRMSRRNAVSVSKRTVTVKGKSL